MALEDIDSLNEEINENQAGHIDDHKKIVRGLKSLKTDMGPSGAVIMATQKWYPNIDTTGNTSASAELNEIFSSAPLGATVKLVGTYLVDSLVEIPSTSFLTIDASAATFLLSGSGTKIRCSGSFESSVNITSITKESLTIENKNRTLTKLTVSSSPTWKTGDLIKIISDDVIPGGHVTSDTVKPRQGEFGIVHSVTGTTVYLKNSLIENYSNSIRAARIIPGSVTLINPTVDIKEASITSKHSINFFRCQSLIYPTVVRPVFKRLTGMGISMKSCFGYSIENPVGFYAMDDTDTGNYGYFVHDSSCQSGRLFGGDLTGGRHAYTDGTADTAAGSSEFADYGASINFKAIGSTARGTTAACWDTHHNSIGAEFIDCSAYPLDEETAFFIRGRKHRVINPKVYGGATLFSAVTQETGTWSQGESYGHELINPWSENTQKIITVFVRTHANHPSLGVRQSSPNVTVHGGTHFGAQRRVVATNGWVELLGASITKLGTSVNGAIYDATNSVITGRDETIDASLVVTIGAGTQRVVFANDTDNTKHSRIEFGHLGISGSSTYMSAASVPIEALSNTERFDFDDIVFDTNWGISVPVAVPDSSLIQNNIKWRYRNIHANSSATQRSSKTLDISNSQISGSHRNIARSIDETLLLTVSISDATARTLSQLWLGKFVGQRLIIFRTNAGANITVLHGSTGRTSLTGSTDKVLSAVGDSLQLIWTGTAWSQV